MTLREWVYEVLLVLAAAGLTEYVSIAKNIPRRYLGGR